MTKIINLTRVKLKNSKLQISLNHLKHTLNNQWWKEHGNIPTVSHLYE